MKLSEVQAGLHYHRYVCLIAIWCQTLNTMNEAKASLSDLTSDSVVILENCALQRACFFKCTDVTVELHVIVVYVLIKIGRAHV